MVVGDSLNLRRNDYGVLNTCSAPFQISASDRVEVSMIEKDVSGRNNDPQLDEEVWHGKHVCARMKRKTASDRQGARKY